MAWHWQLAPLPCSALLFFCAISLTSAQPLTGCPKLQTAYVSSKGVQSGCCGTQAAPCATLQDALAVSDAAAPSQLLLAPGSTFKPDATGLNLSGRNITIAAAAPAPAAAPVIDCNGQACLVAVCSAGAAAGGVACAQAQLSLRGVVVRYGVSTTNGGCVNVGNQRVSLDNVTLEGCYAMDYGGALAVQSAVDVFLSMVVVRNSIVATANGGGGGIALSGVKQATIIGTDIGMCAANESFGGAVFVAESTVTVASGFLWGSTARFAGGGLATLSSTVTLQFTFFSQNLAGSGGCYADTASTVTIDGGSFDYCTAQSVYATMPYINDVSRGGAIYLNGSLSASISGITINGAMSVQEGAGIFAANHGGLNVSRTYISSCMSYQWGAGMAVETGPLTMADSAIIGGLIQLGRVMFGAGLYLQDSLASIVRCNFTANNASDPTASLTEGGAIAFFASYPTLPSSLDIESCLFENNLANYGAGVYVSGNDGTLVTIRSSTFTGNSGVQGGALYFLNNRADISNTTLMGNMAQTYGGAVEVVTMAPITFTRVNFIGNVVTSGDGGAMHVVTDLMTNVTLTQCVFDFNAAMEGRGGAVFSGGTSVVAVASNFTRNTANTKGGAVAVVGSTSSGMSLPPTRVDLIRCELSDNSAGLGGGALFVGMRAGVELVQSTIARNNGTSGGGVAGEDYASVAFNGVTCSGNIATTGGGCLSVTDYAAANVTASTFLGNDGGTEGGALRVSGSTRVSVRRSTGMGNTALSGGWLWSEMDSAVDIVGGSFDNNTAQFYGGAAYLLHSAIFTITGTSFTSNHALLGGAITADGSTVVQGTLCNFSRNAVHAIAALGNASLFLTQGSLEDNSAEMSTTTDAAAGSSNSSSSSSSLKVGLLDVVRAEMSNGSSRTANATSSSSSTSEVGEGGALSLTDSAFASLTGLTFTANTAKLGGAIFIQQGASATARRCFFIDNAAAVGGAVYSGDSSSFSASRCDFEGNKASEMGAGVAFEDSASGTVTSSFFRNNSAGEDGGSGVFLQRGPSGPKAQAILASSSSSSSSSSSASNNSLSLDLKDVTCSALQFVDSQSPTSQGSAYLDASFFPRLRTNCSNCAGNRLNNSIGSLPTSFQMRWAGTSSWGLGPKDPFPVMADINNPVTGLRVTLFDAFGSIAVQDFAAVVKVQPDPRVSGLLQGTAVAGTVVLPPIAILTTADDSLNFTLTVSVVSSTYAFPTITRRLQISFCDPGFYLDNATMTCVICSIGSWCAPGQGTVYCDDGTYSFFPGASSADNCSSCPEDTEITGDSAVTCSQGNCTVLPHFWFDTTSLAVDSTPSVFMCSTSQGCMGMTYESQTTPQCDEGYEESRLCSVCLSGYYFLLGYCRQCESSFVNLFPLLVVLVVLLWTSMAVFSALFHAISMLNTELQIITLLGSLNVTYPDWVTRLIEVMTLSLFSPNIIAPGCQFTYPFTAEWFLTFIVAATGIILYVVSFFLIRTFRLLHLRTVRRRRRAEGNYLPSRAATPYEEGAIRGLVSWLDLNYLPITLRCFQAVYWRYYDTSVLAAAPSIIWLSSPSTLLFGVAVVGFAFYVVLWPVAFLGAMLWAKKKRVLREEVTQSRFGGILSRYEPGYFWWHMVMITRRLFFVILFVFAADRPGLQMSLFLPVQVIRLGIQFAVSPFVCATHDVLASSLALGEIFFAIAITAFNFISLPSLSEVVLYFAIVLVIFPSIVVLMYEVVEKYIRQCNDTAVRRLWAIDIERSIQKQLRERGITATGPDAAKQVDWGEGGPVIPMTPAIVTHWFRDHVIAQILLPARREKEQELLLKVLAAYSRALLGAHQAGKSGRFAELAGAAAEHQEGVEPRMLTDDDGSSLGGGGALIRSSSSGSAVLGNVSWAKGLKKSQLFAALHQVVLGAAVGCKKVAEVPLRADDLAEWADDLRDGGKANLAASRSLARFRSSKSLARSRSSSRKAASPGGGGGGGAAFPRADLSVTSTTPEQRPSFFPRANSSVKSAAAAVMSSGETPDPADQQSRQRPPIFPRATSSLKGPGVTSTAEASAGATPEQQRSSPLAADPTPAFPRADLSVKSNGSGGAPGSGADGGEGEVQVVHGEGEGYAGIGVTGHGGQPNYLELWPPPLEYKATWVVKRYQKKFEDEAVYRADEQGQKKEEEEEDDDGLEAEGMEDGDEYVEALLDSTGLSLAFQESFGQLTMAEMKKKPWALRRLLLSPQIPAILAWMSSPLCTSEERALFVDLLEALRTSAAEEAGQLTWWRCALSAVRQGRPWLGSTSSVGWELGADADAAAAANGNGNGKHVHSPESSKLVEKQSQV